MNWHEGVMRWMWTAGGGIVALLATVQTFHDTDVWWHLQLGHLILSNGIPHSEPFAYAPASQPWVGQQWLYEVILARLTDVSPALASLAFGLLGAGAFVIAARTLPRNSAVHGAWSAAAILVCVFACAQVLGTRGQVITVFGAAVTLWIVRRWRDGGVRVVWLIPPLMLLWANMHAGFFTGPAILAGAYVLTLRAKGLARRPYLLATLAGCAVTLVNPAGVHLWSYVLSTFQNAAITQLIVEWSSPDFHNIWLRLLELVAIALVAAWTLSPRRPDLLDMIFAGGAFAASLSAQRNIALFALVATPQLAMYGSAAWEAHRHRLIGKRRLRAMAPRRALLSGVVLLVAAAAGVLNGLYPLLHDLADGTYERTAEPQLAATYTLAHYHGERIYSTYELGGYLVYRAPAGRVVYLYGESAIFGNNTLEAYLDIHLLRSNWVQQFDHLNPRVAILPDEAQDVSALHELGWGYACHDPAGFVVMAPGESDVAQTAPSDPATAPTCA